MVMTTQKSYETVLGDICGVKSVSLREVGNGEVSIHVRYNFWTYLVPWLNRSVSRKVHSCIFYRKPFNIKTIVKERRRWWF